MSVRTTYCYWDRESVCAENTHDSHRSSARISRDINSKATGSHTGTQKRPRHTSPNGGHEPSEAPNLPTTRLPAGPRSRTPVTTHDEATRRRSPAPPVPALPVPAAAAAAAAAAGWAIAPAPLLSPFSAAAAAAVAAALLLLSRLVLLLPPALPPAPLRASWCPDGEVWGGNADRTQYSA